MRLFALERFMLTPRHRALFEASYSALLLRSEPADRSHPVPTPTPGQLQDPNDMTDKDFGNGAAA
jgi:hypothetical protein